MMKDILAHRKRLFCYSTLAYNNVRLAANKHQHLIKDNLAAVYDLHPTITKTSLYKYTENFTTKNIIF